MRVGLRLLQSNIVVTLKGCTHARGVTSYKKRTNDPCAWGYVYFSKFWNFRQQVAPMRVGLRPQVVMELVPERQSKGVDPNGNKTLTKG